MMKRAFLYAAILLATAFAVLTIVGTGEGERPNALVPTMGGTQLWNDKLLLGGWRIQRHIGTGHCRLLDGFNLRQAWGMESDCDEALEARVAAGDIPSNAKKMALLVHGLGGYGWTFRDMKPALREAGLHAEHWNYASTRGSLADHVAAFHAMMNRLDGVEEVSLVAHSLGGLLLRQALADESQPWRQRINVTGLVMIGTPNQGAALADRFKDSQWFKAAFKGAGQDLTSGYAAQVPLPTVPYCLIAGQLEGEGNPLVPGPDDGMVAVDEVRLSPQDDMLILEGNHNAITSDSRSIQLVQTCSQSAVL